MNTRTNQNSYELRWISSDLYEFVWYYTKRRVATGGSLAFTAPVCESIQNITWTNMDYLEFMRMNIYELRWISSDLYEFVWYYTERRVATGAVLLLQHVCVN
jgi:hypothetical protein